MMYKRLLTIAEILLAGAFLFACSGGTYDMPDGEGIFTYEDKTKIEAEFKDGEIVGECTVSFENGDSYKGELSEGKKTGIGEYRWADGSVYTGCFEEDEKSGKGKLVSSDGAIFEGEFSEDHIKSGTLTMGTEYVYYGDFENDIPCDSDAKIEYSDGTIYMGSVKDGKRSGNGTITYTDNSSISGVFTDNLLQGKASYYLPEAIDTFINNVRYHLNAGKNDVTVKDGAIISVP